MTEVLQVITSSARRGAERFAVALEGELTARGLDVETVALVPGGDGAMDVPHLGSSRLGVATLRELRRRMSEASVAVAHGSTTLPACAIAGAGTGTPFVYRNIGDPHYWGTSRARRLRSQLFLRRAARIVALTSTTRERVASTYSVPIDRIEVIPRGVPADEFSPPTPERREAARQRLGIPADVPLIAYVGSLTEEKDVLNAVGTMGTLPDDWWMLVAGDGPDRSEAEREADRLAPGRVRFIGATDEPAEVMAATDVLVVPSRTEGLPGVAIEAGLAGVPAAVTDVGFVREIVTDRVSGRVVERENGEALALALLDVMEHRHEYGTAIRRHTLDVFALDVVAERWFSVLEPFVSRS